MRTILYIYEYIKGKNSYCIFKHALHYYHPLCYYIEKETQKKNNKKYENIRE